MTSCSRIATQHIQVKLSHGHLTLAVPSRMFLEAFVAIGTPAHPALILPIVHAVPLQLLAYHAAICKETDVDKPRNLAKSVTVE